MKEREWREEIIRLLDDYNKKTSLPQIICNNPMDPMSVKIWDHPEIKRIKKMWNWFKEKLISRYNFMTFLENMLDSEDLVVNFICLLLMGKYFQDSTYYFELFENIYIMEALPGSGRINKYTELSPLAFFLLEKYYGSKKANKIKELRNQVLKKALEEKENMRYFI